jgi:hypothetical protein
MSHFSVIKTKIRNLPALKASLLDLGYQVLEGIRPVKGYQGQTRNAQIVLEQNNNYDIGFSWNGQEYELVADLMYWDQPLSVEGFLRKVTQGYAYHTVLSETTKSGFELSQQQRNEDGSIRLVLQRWSS